MSQTDVEVEDISGEVEPQQADSGGASPDIVAAAKKKFLGGGGDLGTF